MSVRVLIERLRTRGLLVHLDQTTVNQRAPPAGTSCFFTKPITSVSNLRALSWSSTKMLTSHPRLSAVVRPVPMPDAGFAGYPAR